MLVTIKDSMGKNVYINPQFISLIKKSTNQLWTMYDVAGTITFLNDGETVDKLVNAMDECNEICIIPASTYTPSPMSISFAEEEEEQPVEIIEEEAEEVPVPKKKKSRAKKSAK